MASIKLSNLYKKFPNGFEAVKNIDLDIVDKEFMVFVGPSGCGKTTTLRMIAGLEESTRGEILIDGKSVNSVPSKDRDIAMVFQNYALYPHLTVYKNMSFGLAVRKMPKPEIDRRVLEVAKVLGIDKLLDRKPKQLSGGERQRVAMGRAIVREPKAFLMDEPLSALDAKLRTQMRAEISKLHKKLEKTFVYVTHDQTEAMTLGTRVVVMKDGVIQQADTPQNLYDIPANMFVAGFIGSPQMNFFNVTVSNRGLKLAEQTLPLDPERIEQVCGYDNLILGLRPKSISVTPKHEHGISAKVELVEHLGSETYLHVHIANIPCIASVEPDTDIKTGSIIKVGLNMSKAHLFEQNGTRI